MSDHPNDQRCSIQFCRSVVHYTCKRCHSAFYCSPNHQQLHWRSGHKAECMTKEEKDKLAAKIQKQRVDNLLQNKRKVFRKNFVNSYSTAKVEDYLALSTLLEDAEKMNIEEIGGIGSMTEDDHFNYGFTICLVIKSLYVQGHIEAAKSKIRQYVKKHKQFLNFKKYKYKPPEEVQDAPLDEIYTYLERKIELISILANLSYAVGIDHTYLYVMYADHISCITGPESNEMSNVYFLLGCDYADQGFPIKALACFNQCSIIRKSDSETCYYNMAILFYWLGRSNDSISYFNKALVKREQSYGEQSNDVAEVYENLGAVYLSTFDFHSSDFYYSKAMQIRAGVKGIEKMSKEYERLEEQIENLFRKLCSYIESDPPEVEKPQNFVALRQTMLNNRRYPVALTAKMKKMVFQIQKDTIPPNWNREFKERKQSMIYRVDPSIFKKIKKEDLNLMWNFQSKDQLFTSEMFSKKGPKKKATIVEKRSEFTLKISDKIMSLINSQQLFFAAQLEEKLSYIMTQKQAIQEIQNSEFAALMPKEYMEIFRKDNGELYNTALETYPELAQKISRAKMTSKDNNKEAYSNENFSSINREKIVKKAIVND